MQPQEEYNLRPIIASSGRTGTTVLSRAIADCLKDQGFKKATTKQIQKTPRWKHITKTHGFPPKHLCERSRLIFIFGNPYEAVYSYLRIYRQLEVAESFIPEAIRLTCKNKNVSFEEIFNKDIFQMEKRFDSFYRQHSYTIMTLRYETMWNYQKQIANFLKLPEFKLPPFRKRKSDEDVCVSEDEKRKIKSTYFGLKEKIDNAEDIKIWEKHD